MDPQLSSWQTAVLCFVAWSIGALGACLYTAFADKKTMTEALMNAFAGYRGVALRLWVTAMPMVDTCVMLFGQHLAIAYVVFEICFLLSSYCVVLFMAPVSMMFVLCEAIVRCLRSVRRSEQVSMSRRERKE